MKKKIEKAPNRDVKISYRITREQKQVLENKSERNGYSSLSGYLDHILFNRQKRNGIEYPGLVNIMLLKGINDIKLQLVRFSRVYPESSEGQRKLIDIHKILHKIHDDFRRQCGLHN